MPHSAIRMVTVGYSRRLRSGFQAGYGTTDDAPRPLSCGPRAMSRCAKAAGARRRRPVVGGPDYAGGGTDTRRFLDSRA
jgi:hypothetical protein